MMIHEITEKVGAHPRRKRIGRGPGSGHGKTSGRGHKGAHSRSGFSTKLAREGGQMPLFRRFPKRGFSNFQFETRYQIVNVADLQKHFKAGDEVSAKTLAAAGLVRTATDPVKILGNGDFNLKVTVIANKCSASAREKIEAAGGTITEIVKAKWSRPVSDKKAKAAKK